APAGVQLHVHEGERLEPGPEAAAGAAHPLGDGADLAVTAGEQRDDAIGLAQGVGAQDDRVVAVELLLHDHPSLRPRTAPAGQAGAVSARTSVTRPPRTERSAGPSCGPWHGMMAPSSVAPRPLRCCTTGRHAPWGSSRCCDVTTRRGAPPARR